MHHLRHCFIRHQASALTFRRNSSHTLNSTRFVSTVRVRYAPSPTGYLHLGGLRTALFNFLFAKSCNGQFILRIEDTDKVHEADTSRQVNGSVEALLDSLKWCGIREDEGPNVGGPYGPYIQSQRLAIYQEAAEKLVKSGHAYRCFCTNERLQKLRNSQTRHGEATMYDRACLGLDEKEMKERLARGESHTIRLRIPEGKTIVKDILRGYVQFDHVGIDDQVLMKSDGYPTYHLANVVDDHAMRISHVIRGEEWLPSTPKHVILYKALGYEAPTTANAAMHIFLKWAHLGLLLNEDRSKLSKRQGDVAVEDFRDKGFLPSGLVNFVALLGWNPADGNNQEIFQMKDLFSIDHVNKAGSVVNVDRLRWINSRHVRALFTEETTTKEYKQAVVNDVLPMISSALEGAGLSLTSADVIERFGLDYIWRAMGLMKERVSALPEFGPLCVPFFTAPDLNSSIAQKMKAEYIDESTKDLVADVLSSLRDISDEEFTPVSHRCGLVEFSNYLNGLNFIFTGSYHEEYKGGCSKTQTGTENVCFFFQSKTILWFNLCCEHRVLMPIRYYLTGMDVGAGLGDTIELLGRETVFRRLKID
ncbi:hypothetical protein PsorP6_002644 [Peronosclerospora sorghi]|uniref:Uncharacterized protein n=1 Tax=Peronosclerospora sorghi TaxID=230839 RepID=A0ACC0WWC8_9STRA|nr:hypothetical protein PsorP6_002644 [Peronosclerospora sorghi]